MADSPLCWSIAKLVDAYRRRDLSPVEVAELAADRIEEVDAQLHAYLLCTPELALEQARSAEEVYRGGTAGPLAGVPMSIKDAFHIEGIVTTVGSLAHVGDVARADSGAVRRLREAGAVFVGKTNTPEFCQSATTDNLLGPDTTNPWDPARTSGGSSGGAAASVMAATCTAALGSDGGGSIRIPAAFCGVVGVKPTYGSVQDEGGFKGYSPFICAGPLARSVQDAATVLDVLRGVKGADPVPNESLRVGWSPAPGNHPVDRGVAQVLREAVDRIAALGHSTIEVDLDLSGWEQVFGPLLLEEEGRRRGHLLDGPHGLTDYQRRTLEAARELDRSSVIEARLGHEAYRHRIDALFEHHDVLALPATATTAFELGQRPATIDARRVSRLWGAFPFTAAFNVSGHPGVVLPVGLSDGLPVALQLVGRRGDETTMLLLAAQLESALDLNLIDVLEGR
ncbi:MAG: amidase [Actinomycetia bacterium]|nr:amidase [Actinomycetes bacterium]